MDAFEKWRHYLFYSKETIDVLTDHLNLQYIMSKPKLNSRQVRWVETLANFNFRIAYRPGSQNPADGVSRRPDHEDVEGSAEAHREALPRFLQWFKNSQEGPFEGSGIPQASVRGGGGVVCTLSSSTPEMTSILPRFLQRFKNSEEVRSQGVSSEPNMRGVWVALDNSEVLDVPLMEALRNEQGKEEFVTKALWNQRRNNRDPATPVWAIENGLLRYKGKIYVPLSMRAELLSSCHDAIYAGHQGVSKTTKRLSECYYWDNLRNDVKRYVKSCVVCQRTKARRHLPYGELGSLPIATAPGKELSMDFITGLPESSTRNGRRCDSVLVIVDRFSKYAFYLAVTKTMTAAGLADTFFDKVFPRLGLPEGIVSDRGSLFTSRFWSTLCHRLAVERRLSTAFHPQTDGQTERQNQNLEHYLRTFCNYEQNDWVEKLPLAEWVYNTSVHSATKQTPAHLFMGFQPRGPYDLAAVTPGKNAVKGSERAQQLQKDREATAKLLETANANYKKWYNKGRTKKEFAVGQYVLVSTKNINQRRPSRKLADKYLGPFKIEEIVGHHRMAYRLELPPRYRIHDVFHVSCLEPFVPRDGETPEEQQVDPEEDNVYEVEAILGHRGRGRNKEYLIRWTGYTSDDDSWEKAINVSADIKKDYEKQIRTKKQSNAQAQARHGDPIAS